MAEIYDYEAGFDDPGDKNFWFGRLIGSGKRILEVGCATGYVGEHLVRRQQCRVVGVEYVDKAAENAVGRGCYEQVIVGDIQDPATVAVLDPGAFDFVLFGDVLEHLMQPERALENVKPLLKPGGHILICVPSIVHWSIRRDILLGRFQYTDTGPLDRTHVHFFTPKTARDLVTEAGFRIVNRGGVVWLPSAFRRLPRAARRLLERAAASACPNLVHGQVLLDVVTPT